MEQDTGESLKNKYNKMSVWSLGTGFSLEVMLGHVVLA